ncbi:FRG domain-containing protein [Desulfosporosinus sp. SB140]|uniref:FRG domain-containing protein n=1 Tax=Desulfosporosinus paludis TaxID=3115649 RepID=UPI003890E785
MKMKNEFRREIFHRLTPDERNNFLVFAQHHGIPTKLIDFTRSPLVAIFFACQHRFIVQIVLNKKEVLYIF